MATPAWIVLIGMRGCGKSSVGRTLADALGAPFVDLDALVLEREGFPSVAAMWEARGQAAFREAESRALSALLAGEGERGVVALGGGAPTAPGAMQILNDARRDGRARVVYLRCPAATLAARLGDALARDANRPSVTGDDPRAELPALLAAREPVYRAACDAEVDAASGTVEEVARRVRAAVGTIA